MPFSGYTARKKHANINTCGDRAGLLLRLTAGVTGKRQSEAGLRKILGFFTSPNVEKHGVSIVVLLESKPSLICKR